MFVNEEKVTGTGRGRLVVCGCSVGGCWPGPSPPTLVPRGRQLDETEMGPQAVGADGAVGTQHSSMAQGVRWLSPMGGFLPPVSCAAHHGAFNRAAGLERGRRQTQTQGAAQERRLGRWTLSLRPSSLDWDSLSPAPAGPVPSLPCPGSPMPHKAWETLQDRGAVLGGPRYGGGRARWNMWMDSCGWAVDG